VRLWLLGLFLLTACPVASPPGDQPMGLYSLGATLSDRDDCALPEISGADFGFEATLTRDSSSEQAWMTLAGYSREATFDGQYFTSVHSAPRVFAECSDCETQLVETISVSMLSRSQSDAVGGQCPSDALDGGTPGIDPDAGIAGPRQTAQGFDAVRLCGVLRSEVVATGLDGGACSAKCNGCGVRYQLRGDRR
jgi:hypothetical protein